MGKFINSRFLVICAPLDGIVHVYLLFKIRFGAKHHKEIQMLFLHHFLSNFFFINLTSFKLNKSEMHALHMWGLVQCTCTCTHLFISIYHIYIYALFHWIKILLAYHHDSLSIFAMPAIIYMASSKLPKLSLSRLRHSFSRLYHDSYDRVRRLLSY
jgi:hypothetical protein